MRRISVIVCSLNPRPEYFRRLLASLRAQTLPTTDWELIVVDNGSDQPLADTWDLTWHPFGAHVREHELGLTAARIRGIHESNGQLIVFVDDDNVIAPDYLEQALNVERAYPPLAVFGSGIISPEFEATPSDEVKRLVPLLCLRQVSEPRWSNNPEDNEGIPWGAGLCVRRPTADAYAQVLGALSISSSFDRRGQRLFSGGDDLFSWVAAR